MHEHLHQRSRTRHNETQRSVCIGVKLHNCEAYTLLHYSFLRVFTCGDTCTTVVTTRLTQDHVPKGMLGPPLASDTLHIAGIRSDSVG